MVGIPSSFPLCGIWRLHSNLQILAASAFLYQLSHTAKDKALGTDLFYFKLVKVLGLSKPALQVFLEIPVSTNNFSPFTGFSYRQKSK